MSYFRKLSGMTSNASCGLRALEGYTNHTFRNLNLSEDAAAALLQFAWTNDLRRPLFAFPKPQLRYRRNGWMD